MLTDWISAGANVFAAVGTVGAFISGGILLRREVHRDLDRVDEKEREQASKVHAWVEAIPAKLPGWAREEEWMVFTEPPEGSDSREMRLKNGVISGIAKPRPSPASEGDVSYCFCLEIKNLSAGPIFDVYVEELAMFAPLNQWPQRRLSEPGRMLANRMPRRCVLFRSLQAEGSFKLWYGFFREPSTGELPMSCNVAMAFTDCFGLRWRRDRDGQLERIGPNANPEWVGQAQLIHGL